MVVLWLETRQQDNKKTKFHEINGFLSLQLGLSFELGFRLRLTKKHVEVKYFLKNRFATLQNKSETEIDKILKNKTSKNVKNRYSGLNNIFNEIDTCKYEHIKRVSKNEKNGNQKLKRK